MKRIVVVALVAILSLVSLSAMDMSIGLGGLVGADNGEVSGTAIGGSVDVDLDLYKGLGVRIGSQIITSKIKGGDGLTLSNAFSVNIPVMAWYAHDFGFISLGGGLGLGCNVGSGLKFLLSGGLELSYSLSDAFSLYLGVNGNLDAFPTLTEKKNGSDSTYKFVKSDFSKNSVYGSFGLRYHIETAN